MFSIIKFIQNFLKDLKKKKGLWFSVLAISSIIGIFLCLYILSSLTKNISKEVYDNIATGYVKNFKNKVSKKEDNYKKVAVAIKNNNLINNIENNNLTNVNKEIELFNKKSKESGFNTLKLNFYSTFNQVNQYRNSVNSVIASKESAFGVEILKDGIFYVYIEPILKDEKLIGVIELKEEVHELKREYSKDDVIFLFLLEEKMLSKLSIKERSGKYRKIIDTLQVEELEYNGQFFSKIIDLGKDGYKNMLDLGYSVDDTFFRAPIKISDVNGNVVGLVVLGETVEGSGAFVNIVDKMTKTVTTVALGLVISILLFMF